eukprot:PhF_6_TR15617/c0_g1_i1/m.24228
MSIFDRDKAKIDGIEPERGCYSEDLAFGFGYLRQTIGEVAAMDNALAQSLASTVNSLKQAVERQITMLFTYWDVKNQERDKMLRDAQMDVYASLVPKSLLENYLPGSMARSTTPPGSPSAQNLSLPRGNNFVVQKHDDPYKQLSCSIYVILESLMFQLQADTAVAYFHVKSSNTLHAVGAAPDFRSQGPKRSIAAHQGVAGAVFMSGIALSLPAIDDNTKALYYKDDRKEGITYVVDSVLSFPIWGGGKPIGVVEILNKRGGNLSWKPGDESLALGAATLLGHLFQYLPVSFANQHPYNPAPLRSIRQLHTLAEHGLDVHEYELDSISSQLILRGDITGNTLARVDPKDSEKLKNHEKTTTVTTPNLKEFHSYLANLELSYRNGLNSVVVADKELQSLQDELAKRNHKIRILEDNLNYVNDQFLALKAKLSPSENPVTGHEANYKNYEKDGKDKKSSSVDSGRRGHLCFGSQCSVAGNVEIAGSKGIGSVAGCTDYWWRVDKGTQATTKSNIEEEINCKINCVNIVTRLDVIILFYVP